MIPKNKDAKNKTNKKDKKNKSIKKSKNINRNPKGNVHKQDNMGDRNLDERLSEGQEVDWGDSDSVREHLSSLEKKDLVEMIFIMSSLYKDDLNRLNSAIATMQRDIDYLQSENEQVEYYFPDGISDD
jgi:hypothetical protein